MIELPSTRSQGFDFKGSGDKKALSDEKQTRMSRKWELLAGRTSGSEQFFEVEPFDIKESATRFHTFILYSKFTYVGFKLSPLSLCQFVLVYFIFPRESYFACLSLS